MKISKTREFAKNEALGNCVAFSPKGDAVASCGGTIDEAGQVVIWSLPSGRRKTSIESTRRDGDMSLSISMLAFSPNASSVAFAHHAADEVKLWKPGKSRASRRLALFSRPTSWNKDGQMVGDTHIGTMSFSPSGNLLAVGCWDCTAKVWDLREDGWGKRLLNHGDQNVDFVTFSLDETKLITGTSCYLCSWNLATGEMVRKISLGAKGKALWYHGATGCLAPVISVSWKGEVRLWDAEWNYTSSRVKMSGAVNCLAYSQRDELMAIALPKDKLLFWKDGALVGKMKVDYPTSIDFSPKESSFCVSAGSPTNAVVQYHYEL